MTLRPCQNDGSGAAQTRTAQPETPGRLQGSGCPSSKVQEAAPFNLDWLPAWELQVHASI